MLFRSLLEVLLDFVVVYRLDALVVVGSLSQAKVLKDIGPVLVWGTPVMSREKTSRDRWLTLLGEVTRPD